MASFDVNDRSSWYFGSMGRQEATDLLMGERESGVFLVRDSNSMLGDFVLCVREDTKVSHYIINKIPHAEQAFFYRIGDQNFSDLPDLLAFYKLHYLDTTPLRRPAQRPIELVIGKFDFEGSGDQDDLPFRRGEILTVISKDEEQWWTAKNSLGKIGQIPVPYVQKYDRNSSGGQNMLERNATDSAGFKPAGAGNVSGGGGGTLQQLGSALKKSDLNRKLPALARVKQARVPNAYDKTALKLEVGDTITVTKTNINGQWEGELNGKKGHFPFTHVEFIEPNDNENHLSSSIATTITTTTTASTTGNSIDGVGGGAVRACSGSGGGNNLINEWCD